MPPLSPSFSSSSSSSPSPRRGIRNYRAPRFHSHKSRFRHLEVPFEYSPPVFSPDFISTELAEIETRRQMILSCIHHGDDCAIVCPWGCPLTGEGEIKRDERVKKCEGSRNEMDADVTPVSGGERKETENNGMKGEEAKRMHGNSEKE